MTRYNAMLAAVLNAAETEMSKGDIILRTFIGMVFIMVLMFLAVIVTGKIGRLRDRQQEQTSDSEESAQAADDEQPQD